MSDLEKMVIDELNKAVADKKLIVVFRHYNKAVLSDIRQIAERLGANFLSIGIEVENYVLTMGLKRVRQMKQAEIKKLKFLVIEKDGKRMAIDKRKIISVKELTERNSVGAIVHKVSLTLQDVSSDEQFTEIVVYDSFANIMLQLEA